MKGSWIALTALALALLAAPAAQADWSGDSKGDVLAVGLRRAAPAVPRHGRRRLRDRHRRADRRGLEGLHGRLHDRRLQRRRARRPARPPDRRDAADVPRRRRRRLPDRQRRADRRRLAVASPRCSAPATGPATARPTSWPAPATARSCSTAATAPAGSSRARRSRSGAAGRGFTALLAPGDWSGDGKSDLLARAEDGALFLYRGNGAGRVHQPVPAGRLRLAGVRRAGLRRRLQRRREARRARAPALRRAVPVPRQRRRAGSSARTRRSAAAGSRSAA